MRKRHRYICELGDIRRPIYGFDLADAIYRFVRPYVGKSAMPVGHLIRVTGPEDHQVEEVPLDLALTRAPHGSVIHNSRLRWMLGISQGSTAADITAGGFYLYPNKVQEAKNNRILYARLQEIRQANKNGLANVPYQFG